MKIKYRKLRPGDALYEFVQHHKKAGNEVCDAWTHNSPRGCANPDCFKYERRRAP